MRYREATQDDWEAVAALHALSWQKAYRGALRDDFPDVCALRGRTHFRIATPGRMSWFANGCVVETGRQSHQTENGQKRKVSISKRLVERRP